MPGIAQALFCHGGGTPATPSANLIEFVDGSEFYLRQDDRWKGATNSSAPASGVSGAHGLVCDDSVWGTKSYNLVTPSDEITLKFRVIFRVDSGDLFVSLRNGANTHLQVTRQANDTLRVSLPGGVTHDSTDTYAINTWYEFEVYLLVHDSAGAYRVKVDGVIPSKSGGGTLNQTGLDTQATATTVSQIRVGSSTLQTYTDDHVLCIAGADIGLGQVETLRPTGAGDLTQLTRGGTDSGANWSQVDESTENTGDYVFSSSSNQRDCYAFGNLTVSGDPLAVQVAACVVRHTAGAFTFKFFLRIGGVNYDGAVTHTCPSTSDVFQECWTNNPATGNAWTRTEVDGLQAGVLCVDANVRPTLVALEVPLRA